MKKEVNSNKENTPANKNAETTDKILYYLLNAFCIAMMGLGFVFDTPRELFEGMIIIMTVPGRLLTDYMEAASIGAAFFNGGLLTLLSIILIRSQKVKFTGPLIAGIFTIFGFSLFGKTLFNSIPMTLGVYLFSRLEKRPFSHYLLFALFATALGPAVSNLAFGVGLPTLQGVLLSYAVGIVIGLIIPPLGRHFLSFHQGFNLYNIGFTAGIVGMLIVAIMNLFGKDVETVSILSSGNNGIMAAIMFGICIIFFGIGFYLNGMSLRGYGKMMKHSGKLVTDLLQLEGPGLTLINMGLLGMLGTGYVLLVGGELNGPVIGCIFTLIGFGAFGKHLRNCVPIFIGVYLAALLNVYGTPYSITAVLAALMGTTLAPISGFYGGIYGVIAGFLHMSLVANVGFLHGGLNLYNNGFSGGFVAAILAPIFDALQTIKGGIKART